MQESQKYLKQDLYSIGKYFPPELQDHIILLRSMLERLIHVLG